MKRFVPAAALLAWLFVSAGTVWAGKRCCNKCGCESQVKKVCRAVLTYEDVAIPNYQFLPTASFHPHKGKVCKDEYRYNTFCTLHKNCDGSRQCCCKSAHGCKTLYGALPSGCTTTCNVRQPVGSTRQRIPVMKWVTVELCEDCCDSRKSHR